MDVVILHCHFERGGVTQVVENHVRALRDASAIDRIVLVSGPRVGGLSETTLQSTEQIVLDGFDYDSRQQLSNPAEVRAHDLAGQLQAALHSCGVAPAGSVLHWHNHSLGKNNAAPSVIARMAKSSWRLLLQVHDFAEDSRPGNYAGIIGSSGAKSKVDVDRFLYPVADQIHYAALTQTDTDVFTQLGIPATRTHCLPNSVAMSESNPIARDEALTVIRRSFGLPKDARWSLYPVRGIRRKNVGEFTLLSRWLGENGYAGITLCPATPVEKRSYERWRLLAADIAPRSRFDVGHHVDVSYAQNVAAADFILSTSVAEGFGMVFLEPWLAKRGVIARQLETVTKDFVGNGLQFPVLYDQILIPGTTAWCQQCLKETNDAHDVAWSQVPEKFRPSPRSHQTSSDAIDFARLTPNRQQDVLGRLHRDEGFERETKSLSHDLISHLSCPVNEGLIDANAKRIHEVYSPAQQTEHLMDVYDKVVSAPISLEVAGPANAGTAVDTISRIRPFYPCRTEELIDG
ncbi:MAG: hypothetical protein HKN47_01485 [Pirellulaceae bacterium]|nr:hypothetical protein [Pirellulaceae bacterium]